MIRRPLFTLFSAASLAVATPAQTAPDLPSSASHELFETANGTFGVDGRGYRATFDARGASIRVAETELSFRLTDWGRVGDHRATQSEGITRENATTVRYSHEGIAERYRITATGFEQSFVIEQKPAGSGDLVLGIAATSASLHATAVDPAHQPLSFFATDLPTIRYGEAVVFERGGNPRPIATRYDGRGRIELTVPSTFVDRANFPIIVDPTVGPLLTPGDVGYDDEQPDVACEPTHGFYLAVWKRTYASGFTAIHGRRYDIDGSPLGNSFAIAGPPFVVPLTYGAPCVAHHPTIGWLVGYSRGSNIEVVPVDHFGTVLSSDKVVTHYTATNTNPTIGCTDEGAFVACERTLAGNSDPTQIVLRYVDLTGATPSNGPSLLVQDVTAPSHVRAPQLPKQLLRTTAGGIASISRMVWERFYPTPAPGDSDVRTTVIRYDGALTTNNSSTVAGAGTIGLDETSPSIGMNALQGSTDPTDEMFLIAWNDDSDLRAHRYDLVSAIGTEIELAATSSREIEPAVGSGYCEFAVGYIRAPASSAVVNTVRAACVTRDATVHLSDYPVNSQAVIVNGQLAASHWPIPAGPAYSVNRSMRNRTMFTWQAEVGSSFPEHEVRAHLYDTVTGNVYPYGQPCPGPAGELPICSTDGEPHPGNNRFPILLDDAPPNSLVVLVVSDQFTFATIPGAPGCNLHAGLPWVAMFATLTDPTGSSNVGILLPCDMPVGAKLAFQWGIYTPGHNPFGWIVSNDLDVTWGIY